MTVPRVTPKFRAVMSVLSTWAACVFTEVGIRKWRPYHHWTHKCFSGCCHNWEGIGGRQEQGVLVGTPLQQPGPALPWIAVGLSGMSAAHVYDEKFQNTCLMLLTVYVFGSFPSCHREWVSNESVNKFVVSGLTSLTVVTETPAQEHLTCQFGDFPWRWGLPIVHLSELYILSTFLASLSIAGSTTNFY